MVALRAARALEKEHERAEAAIKERQERLATIMPNLTLSELQALHSEVHTAVAETSTGAAALALAATAAAAKQDWERIFKRKQWTLVRTSTVRDGGCGVAQGRHPLIRSHVRA
jgi:hypothetical protein